MICINSQKKYVSLGQFFYEFLVKNNLHNFVIFTCFVNIWTLSAYKKKLWQDFQYFLNVIVKIY